MTAGDRNVDSECERRQRQRPSLHDDVSQRASSREHKYIYLLAIFSWHSLPHIPNNKGAADLNTSVSSE